MRRRKDHSRNLRGGPRQIDLFSPIDLGEAAGAPGWADLPEETRETLTRLMVCLILEHADRAPGRRAAAAYRQHP
jgi:hypothetical protein